MSENVPQPRPGYTRTGKSLKAVRRYYAMKRKRDRSPDEEEEKASPKREERYQSVSKRKRDDDKLSKRIAAELRTQQEANEKRKYHEPGSPGGPPMGPGQPLSIKQQETGPTFVTEPEKPLEETPSPAKEFASKSNKSVKSFSTLAQILVERPQELINGLSPSALGCILACFILSVVYLVTWIFVSASNSNQVRPASSANDMRSLTWLGVTSVVVIITIPYWQLCKANQRHAIACLTLMTACTISIIGYFIFFFTLDTSEHNHESGAGKSGSKSKMNPHQASSDLSQIHLWLPITFLISHIITDSFMIRQVINVLAKQMDERSTGTTHMSVYLAPN